MKLFADQPEVSPYFLFLQDTNVKTNIWETCYMTGITTRELSLSSSVRWLSHESLSKYLTPAKFGQGNVFTYVCHSVHKEEGFCVWYYFLSGCLVPCTVKSGRYSSYWKAFFFHFCFRSGEVKQLRSAVGFNVFALLIHEWIYLTCRQNNTLYY